MIGGSSDSNRLALDGIDITLRVLELVAI